MGTMKVASALGIPNRPGREATGGRRRERFQEPRASVLLEALPPVVASEGRVDGVGDSAPSEEEIRLRAYELYLERGSAPGSPEGDWHRAERELRRRRAGER